MHFLPLLQARDLNVSIAGHPVCQSLDFSLLPGECLAILGRNGAGKSTLLSVLAGLRPPVHGKLLLQGRSYEELGVRAAARIRGWLPQTRADVFASTVLETTLAGRHPHLGRWEWESRADAEIASAALEAVGLAGFAARDVQTLSGGERQRLAIATLLTQSPQLYLLDEPVAHLDLNHQIATLELFAARVRHAAVGCVMVLHEPGLATRFCDRALLLFADGRTELRAMADVDAPILSRLYGHPLHEVRDGDRRWFVPA